MDVLYCNDTDRDQLYLCVVELTFSFRFSLTLLSVLFIVVGVSGNSLVLSTVIRFARLRTYSNTFVANLAIADLGALFTGFTTLLLGLHCQEELRGNAWICQLLLHFTFLFIFTSVTTLQIIAVDRYLIITRLRGVYNLYYRRWRIWALVGGTWVIGIVMTEFSLFTSFVCGDAYMGALHSCYVDVTSPLSMACITASLFLSCFLCMVTIPFFYGRTFRKVRTARERSRRRPTSNTQADGTGRGLPRTDMATFSKEEIMITKMMAIVYVTYMLCWTPMLLTHLSYFGRGCPSYVAHYVCAILALLNSSLNPLIYAGVSRSFRESFARVFRREMQTGQNVAVAISMDFNNSTRSGGRPHRFSFRR